ncbi:MAG: molybdopterin-dependent oxidoreductase [Nitriliruptorales bacterium]|nr:molybdopterin-dependent oxidoreductase [Nitriliruptorales bacterium]
MGTSFGRGGATTFQQDLVNSDCVVIMGSNMAECHPVGFQWVVEAQARGATVFHVDPRFTRTSALADHYVPLRAGSDIAFLGGVVNYILSGDHDFRDYVLAYTNASHVIVDGVALPDDLDGVFSGFDESTRSYDHATWQYGGEDVDIVSAAGRRERVVAEADRVEEGGQAFEGVSIEKGGRIEKDPTLQHPRCVYQLLKRHYARYTPELVADACGVSVEQFRELAQALCDNSGRDRTSVIVYSVGWTQHTTGVQCIRAASIIQLLLGNMGRPGGGILALRGHASIQGSTDIPTLYDLLPGYLPMPSVGRHDTLDSYEQRTSSRKGFWANSRAYMVSLLKAWWGDAATPDNDFCFGYLPRISGDHSAYRTAIDMLDRKVRGYILLGQNPAVGSANSRLHRLALAHLDWLVVRDLTMIESATFWLDGPEIDSGELRPEDIATEVFFLPAAAHVEKDGTFTNTQRVVQWHAKAVEPKGDCRSDLWFTYHLGRRVRAKLAGAGRERDRPVLDLTWEYPMTGLHNEVDAAAVLQEINGWGPQRRPLNGFAELRADGSTACGCWIYSGCYAGGQNATARRVPGSQQSLVAPEWAWAWPANRRILYNRASADPQGRPWSQRKAYVWWDDEAQAWTGHDVPDFPPHLAPDAVPPADAVGVEALAGDDAFIMQADGKGWLWAPAGLVDGPLPTHYEPHESPVRNPVQRRQSSPFREQLPHEHNPTNDASYPFVATTYRVAEHHTAGGMSRHQRRLSELAREMFVEVHPELAALRGLEHGGWATVSSSRSTIEARVLVTERMQPVTVDGRRVHQVGLPYHWGPNGTAPGDAANDLFAIVLDPNVHIQEVKSATCDVTPGRRPRGRKDPG